MSQWYREDLAYIHDVGFGDYAIGSAPGILEILAHHNIRDGLVVDLGCGSGLSAQALAIASYRVLGVDISSSAIAIARTRVPEAVFKIGSLFEVEIPPCHAIISIGECLNYRFDANNNRQTLLALFHRIYRALSPGGVFIFDLAEPGQVMPGAVVKGFTEGEGWVVLVEKEEDRDRELFTRRIITFRQVGDFYRRDDEIHYLQLYKSVEVVEDLNTVGFQVTVMKSYGEYDLPKAHSAFIAHKSVEI
jgi:SAM-dependent methyltransferase